MKKEVYLIIETTLAVIYFLFGIIIISINKNWEVGLTLFGIALMFASNWMSERVTR